jgi:thiamine biosynthesis lipoprotein
MSADITFRAMGSEIRLIIGDPEPGADEPDPERAARESREFIERYEQCLSRFRPESELSALNADPRAVVPASPLLRDAVTAAVRAARATDGLVDPTLVDEIEAVGYLESREGATPARLRDALLLAPARAPAHPSSDRRWAQIEVDEEVGVIRRPPGVRIDSGGIGKGLAADLLAERLSDQQRFVVNCGGDLRVGGRRPGRFEVLAQHPLTGEHDQRLWIEAGAIATSGLNVRVWRRENGRYAHHLLDPETGEPAWTGLVGATALAPSGVEAETLSKAALLSGPAGARRLLAAHGGLIVHEDGEVEPVGGIDAGPKITVTLPAFPMPAPNQQAEVPA